MEIYWVYGAGSGCRQHRWLYDKIPWRTDEVELGKPSLIMSQDYSWVGMLLCSGEAAGKLLREYGPPPIYGELILSTVF